MKDAPHRIRTPGTVLAIDPVEMIATGGGPLFSKLCPRASSARSGPVDRDREGDSSHGID